MNDLQSTKPDGVILKLVPLLIISLYSAIASAEYRVYQYYVRSRHSLPQDQNSYLVTSTLDPESYLSYNGGRESIKVELLRTWICPGFTGEKQDYCPSPYENLPIETTKSKEELRSAK